MTSPQKSIFSTVELPDEAFFDLDAKSKQRLLLEAGDRAWQGLELAGPRAIQAGKHDRLPLLLLMQDSFAHANAVRFADVAIVVGVDLDSGAARVCHVVEPDRDLDADVRPRRDAQTEQPAPTGAMATARVRDVLPVDLARVFRAPTAGARYAATAIAFDRRSEPAGLVVTSAPPAGSAPPAMSREEARQLVAGIEAKAARGMVAPTYAFPGLMPEEGVRVSLPARWKIGSGPIEVGGSVCVALGAGEIVAAEGPGGDAEPASLPDAFGHGLFLLTEQRRREPYVLPLVVAIRGRSSVRAGDRVAFEFGFELQRLVPTGLRPGAYHGYLLAGRHVSGPHELVVEAP